MYLYSQKKEIDMRKTFNLEGLDCANCAAKIEAAIRALEGVKEVSISFLTQKMTLEAEDAIFDEVLNKAEAVMKSLEDEIEICR